MNDQYYEQAMVKKKRDHEIYESLKNVMDSAIDCAVREYMISKFMMKYKNGFLYYLHFILIFLMHWYGNRNNRRLGETTRTLIFSDRVSPNKLRFSIPNPTVYMYWDCDIGGFTMRNTANNILDTDIEDGYNLIRHDIKIDGEKKSIVRYQSWNSEFISLDWYN